MWKLATYHLIKIRDLFLYFFLNKNVCISPHQDSSIPIQTLWVHKRVQDVYKRVRVAIPYSFMYSNLAQYWWLVPYMNLVLKSHLKCNNSNSTLAVPSGFDLHRFLQVLSHFGKKNRKRSCQGWDLNLGPADHKSVVLTISPWLLNEGSSKSLSI